MIDEETSPIIHIIMHPCRSRLSVNPHDSISLQYQRNYFLYNTYLGCHMVLHVVGIWKRMIQQCSRIVRFISYRIMTYLVVSL